MRLKTGYETKKSRIEIVPLIDVMFLLLASFIYATLSMGMFKGVKVDLPRGQGMSEKKENVMIIITADNQISVDGVNMTTEQAIIEAAERSRRSQNVVLIRGDKSANLGVAVELLAGLKKHDVKAIAFQVEEKNE